MTENKPKSKTYTMRISIELYEKLEIEDSIKAYYDKEEKKIVIYKD